MQINITSLGGEVYTIQLDTDDRIIDVKKKLKRVCGIPVSEQILVVGNAVLFKDHRKVSESRKFHNVTEMHLIRRPAAHAEIIRKLRTGGVSTRASLRLVKADPQAMYLAVCQSPSNLQFASTTLQKDSRFLESVLSRCPRAILHVNKAKVKMKTFLGVAKNDPSLLHTDLAREWQGNPEFVREVLKMSPGVLSVPFGLCTQQAFVREAVKIDPHCIQYADISMTSNPEILREAVRTNSHCLPYADLSLLRSARLGLVAVHRAVLKDQEAIFNLFVVGSGMLFVVMQQLRVSYLWWE